MFFRSTGNNQIDAAFDLAFAEAFAGRDIAALRTAMVAVSDMEVPPGKEAEKQQVIADMRAELAKLEQNN